MTEERLVTYEITFAERGPLRITIPATWKVTYSALIPGKPGAASMGPTGLRIWEGTDKQRAVFVGVTSFRDLSIPTKIAAIRKYGTEDWYADDGQTWTNGNADKVQKAWMPEEEVQDGAPPWLREVLNVSDEDAGMYRAKGARMRSY